MMYSASCGDDVPSTIVCHYFLSLEHEDYDEDVMNFSSSSISSLNDSRHLIEDMSHATEVRSDHVTSEDLRAMKEMVASMRRNPDLLYQSPIMRRASCLSTASPRRHTTDKASPGENDVVKDEDLCAMKDMIASMRQNPMLLYQSPVMQKACTCSTTANTTRALTHDAPSLISSFDTTSSTLPASTRRSLGTNGFDPSTLPSLPFENPQCTQFEVIGLFVRHLGRCGQRL